MQQPQFKNLVGVHAPSASVSAVTFFGTVQRCFTFFAASTHRWDVLKSNCSVTVKLAVDTRWSARKDAVSCLKKVFSRVVDTLEILTDEEETQETREEAGLLLSALQTFPFLCFLYMWDPILSEVDITQKYLQQKDLDLIQCASKIRNLDEFLQRQGMAERGVSTESWDVVNLLQWIAQCKLQETVPNLIIAIRIYLTMAVSVASCERSFSKLKLIKTYLRSTMGQNRLTNLAILSIEREQTEGLDFDEVINQFASTKSRKAFL